MKLYGLKTCDTCRKALKALPDAEFVHLDDANTHLQAVCTQLNALPQAEADGQSAQAILERERAYLLPVLERVR